MFRGSSAHAQAHHGPTMHSTPLVRRSAAPCPPHLWRRVQRCGRRVQERAQLAGQPHVAKRPKHGKEAQHDAKEGKVERHAGAVLQSGRVVGGRGGRVREQGLCAGTISSVGRASTLRHAAPAARLHAEPPRHSLQAPPAARRPHPPTACLLCTHLPARTCDVKASEKSSTTAATVFSTSCTQKLIQPYRRHATAAFFKF